MNCNMQKGMRKREKDERGTKRLRRKNATRRKRIIYKGNEMKKIKCEMSE